MKYSKRIHQKINLWKNQDPAESEFFLLLCIKIKITNKYEWIVYFLKDKTIENDLWWVNIVSYAAKFTIFSDYGLLSWKKKLTLGIMVVIFIDKIISFAWQVDYMDLEVSWLIKSIICWIWSSGFLLNSLRVSIT